MYEPIASATLSLATVAAGVFLAKSSAWTGVFWKCRRRASRSTRRLRASRQDLLLAVLAAVMTLGQIRIATVGTLLIASAALGLAAVARRWIGAGYAAAVDLVGDGHHRARLSLARRFERAVTSPIRSSGSRSERSFRCRPALGRGGLCCGRAAADEPRRGDGPARRLGRSGVRTGWPAGDALLRRGGGLPVDSSWRDQPRRPR